MKAAILVGVVMALLGCAQTRYLTAEEDAKMREWCGEPKDCTVLKGEEWRVIEQMLRKFGITGI